MVSAPLALHSRVTREAALKAFGAGLLSQHYCDGQFVVTRKTILLFAKIGRGGTRMEAADRLEWRPERADYHPGEKIPWFPAAVIPEYSQKRKAWKRGAHVFLAGESNEVWLYAGPAHLGSYEYSNNREKVGFAVYHFARLPREDWLVLGGYPGWEVRVNGVVTRLGARELAAFERLLDELAEGLGHVSLTRWEGDEMSVHLNETRGFPMYLSEPADPGFYVLGEDGGGAKAEQFSCGCCGIEMEFAGEFTLPRGMALNLVKRYFRSGKAPEDRATVPGGIWVRDIP